FIAANVRAPRRLAEGLKAMARFMQEEQRALSQNDMFGREPSAPHDLYRHVNTYPENEYGDNIALIDVQGETASPVASGDAGGQPDAGARAATDQPRAPPGAPSEQTQAIGQLPAPPDAGQPQT